MKVILAGLALVLLAGTAQAQLVVQSCSGTACWTAGGGQSMMTFGGKPPVILFNPGTPAAAPAPAVANPAGGDVMLSVALMELERVKRLEQRVAELEAMLEAPEAWAVLLYQRGLFDSDSAWRRLASFNTRGKSLAENRKECVRISALLEEQIGKLFEYGCVEEMAVK